MKIPRFVPCVAILFWIATALSAVAKPFSFATLAGLPGTVGSSDGAGTAARLNTPYHLCVDLQGNTFVADYLNHVIRKITPTGDVAVFAGSPGQAGAVDALGTAARFRAPAGVAVADDGTVFVADTGNHTIRKITPAGQVSTLAGLALSPGTADGSGGVARFNFPNGVAVGPNGLVFVADTYNHTIRQISSAGAVTTVSGQPGVAGSNDGQRGLGQTSRFNLPTGLVFDSQNGSTLIVADYGNHTIRTVLITPGEFGDAVTTAGAAGQPGEVDGNASTARFNHPIGVALGENQVVYITDYGGHTVRKLELNTVSTLGGQNASPGTADGTGTAARFNQPVGIAVTYEGMLVVCDSGNHRISLGLRRSEPGEFQWGALAGRRNYPESVDGTRATAHFRRPSGVATDAAGNVFVADREAHIVRKVTPDGVTTTVAGTTNSAGSEDNYGVQNQNRLNGPRDVAIDAAGNLYIADSANFVIRRLSSAGVMSTVAGQAGQSGHVNATGNAARFGLIEGIAIGPDQNLYIADTGNHVIRKMTPAGAVSALAGNPGSPGQDNGTGTAARFSAPRDVVVNAAGICYVGDGNFRLIRAVTPAGVVTTLAGTSGFAGIDGPGVQATFASCQGLAIDRDGTLYVADGTAVRRVSPGGYVSTITGNTGGQGIFGYGPGKEAFFPSLYGIAVNAGGQIVVSDSFSGIVAVGTEHGGRLRRTGGTASLAFGAEPLRGYFFERSTTLKSGQWTTLGTVSADFSGGINQTDPAPPAGTALYRLRPR